MRRCRPVRSSVARRGTWMLIVLLLGVTAAGLLAGSRKPQDRAYGLEQRLRCPTCQSVSVADSPSETAAAMRTTIAEQVIAGRSDQQIIDYFRARYGAWVLFDPPASGVTLVVWVLPLLAGGVGTVVLVMVGRRTEPPTPLEPEERERVVAEVRRFTRGVERDEEP